MARIESGELGDKGREREWLARAVRAPRDRAWIADGYVSDRWLPVSPVTGAVDGFEWKAPVDAIGRGDDTLLIDEPIAPEPSPSLALPRVSEVVEVRPATEKDEAPVGAPSPAPVPAPAVSEPKPKPKIFVPERPPDDPGVAQAETEDSPTSLERLRAAQIR
jgi:HemY protein